MICDAAAASAALVVLSACVCTFDYLFRFVPSRSNRGEALVRSLARTLATYCDFFVHACSSTRAHAHTLTHTFFLSAYHQLFTPNTTAHHARSVKVSTGQHNHTTALLPFEQGKSAQVKAFGMFQTTKHHHITFCFTAACLSTPLSQVHLRLSSIDTTSSGARETVLCVCADVSRGLG